MTYTITPLLTGVRNPDQGMMTYQQGHGQRIWLCIWAFLVQGDGKNILIDTGLSEDEAMNPQGFKEETGLEVKTMTEALADVGLTPKDIHAVINTHLHDDHCGNNPLFTKAEFYAHEKELDFCRNPHPLDHRMDEQFIEGIKFKTLKDDVELFPGIEVFFTPGHTPGTVSVRVNTASGPVVIPGFCCIAKNFPATGPAICPGVHCDAFMAYDNAQKIKDMKGTIIPVHDTCVGGMKF